MMNKKLRFFCFHRKHLSFFLLFILNYMFCANVSNSGGVLAKTDGAFIKVENDALLYIEDENGVQKENAKIYVAGGTVIKNISEITNAEVVNLDKEDKLLPNKKATEQGHHRVKKNKKIVQQKKSANKVKTYFVLDSSEIFWSFGESESQFIIPGQNSPKTTVILNKTVAIVIDNNFKNTNSLFLNNPDWLTSFNPDFSVRPPPFSKE